MAVDQQNRIAERLDLLEIVAEARRIQARTDANQSRVTSSELRQRLAQRRSGENPTLPVDTQSPAISEPAND